MDPQTYHFQWQGIDVEATYTPLKWGVIAHLEIQSISPARAPLPITSTGYRSQVIEWLYEEAAKPEWQLLSESSRQGQLF